MITFLKVRWDNSIQINYILKAEIFLKHITLVFFHPVSLFSFIPTVYQFASLVRVHMNCFKIYFGFLNEQPQTYVLDYFKGIGSPVVQSS